MGHSIYYDRAFIRVGDQYIPLVNTGASNGAEYLRGRLVPEKDWSVLNWKHRGQVLFTEPEIREIAKFYDQYNQENGMSYKPRGKCFEPGEMERWIIGGMKRAYTIEEYRSFGNVINVVDYPNGMAARWRRQPFSTDEELHDLLKNLNAGHEFDISFGNNREVIRPDKRKAKEQRAAAGTLTPFAAIFGVTGATPAASRTDGEKPSVLDAISGARGKQYDVTAAPNKSALKKAKSHDPEI